MLSPGIITGIYVQWLKASQGTPQNFAYTEVYITQGLTLAWAQLRKEVSNREENEDFSQVEVSESDSIS